MTYGAVRQNSGSIAVASEPGKGTAFALHVPLLTSPGDAPAAPTSSAPGSAASGRFSSRRRHGAPTDFQHRAERVRLYHYEATDGEEAVALFRERSDAIAPVILDIVMPKKSGKEVYEDLRRIRPGSKALFISGHPADIIHDKGMLDRELPFLSKPIALQTLLRKVRDVPGVRA
jgi:two-component system cell cycle sensor histidine kinase/response regulator CckA